MLISHTRRKSAPFQLLIVFLLSSYCQSFLRCGSNIKHKVGIVFCKSGPVTMRLLTWGNLMLFLMLSSAACEKMCVLASENQGAKYFLSEQGL